MKQRWLRHCTSVTTSRCNEKLFGCDSVHAFQHTDRNRHWMFKRTFPVAKFFTFSDNSRLHLREYRWSPLDVITNQYLAPCWHRSMSIGRWRWNAFVHSISPPRMSSPLYICSHGGLSQPGFTTGHQAATSLGTDYHFLPNGTYAWALFSTRRQCSTTYRSGGLVFKRRGQDYCGPQTRRAAESDGSIANAIDETTMHALFLSWTYRSPTKRTRIQKDNDVKHHAVRMVIDRGGCTQ